MVLFAACASGSPGGAAGGAASEEVSANVAQLVEAAERAREREDYDSAVSAYRQAYDKTPWNDRVKLALAATYAERAAKTRSQGGVGALDAAEADMRKALELNPDDPTLRTGMARVLLEQSERESEPARSGALREEARSFDAAVVDATPAHQVTVERRLDLAWQLIERGQLEAGIADLERLHTDYPDHRPTSLLLARSLVRQGNTFASLGDYPRAGHALDRAVYIYESGLCLDGGCDPQERRLAHQNRIVVWAEAKDFDRSRHALKQAQEAGLEFPKLRGRIPD